MEYWGIFLWCLQTVSVIAVFQGILIAIRHKPEWHWKVFLLGARFGKVFFPAVGALVLGSGWMWLHTNLYFHEVLWRVAMWAYAASSMSLLAVGKLATLRRGNAAMIWRAKDEAGMHFTASTLSAREARAFVDMVARLWKESRELGITRVRMLSPLLGSEERCRRFGEMMQARLLEAGVACDIEYIEPRPWNWLMSVTFVLRHGKKARFAQAQAAHWYQRVFCLPVGGFRLIAR